MQTLQKVGWQSCHPITHTKGTEKMSNLANALNSLFTDDLDPQIICQKKWDQFHAIVAVFKRCGVFENQIVDYAIGKQICDIALADDPAAHARGILAMIDEWKRNKIDDHFVKIGPHKIEIEYVTSRVIYDVQSIANGRMPK